MFEMADIVPGGTLATVYHRTHNIDNVKSIFNKGYRLGSREFYGPSLYTCYELSSQFFPYMQRYGDYVVKFGVNVSTFLNFDKIKELPGPEIFKLLTSLYRKIKGSGHFRDNYDLYDERISKIIALCAKNKGRDYSSEIARSFLKGLTTSSSKSQAVLQLLDSGIDGLLFTSGHDGKEAVIYRSEIAIPMSWAFAPVEQGYIVKWTKLDNSYPISTKYNTN